MYNLKLIITYLSNLSRLSEKLENRFLTGMYSLVKTDFLKVCILWCNLIAPCWLNVFPQSGQLYNFSFECTTICLDNVMLFVNPFVHSGHFNRLSLLWISLCSLRSLASENRSLQTPHWNFDCVCICKWRFNCLCVGKYFSHILHCKYFSPVWTTLCWVRFADFLNILLQISQLYGFSPRWIRIWFVRCPDWLKADPHSLHTYCLIPRCEATWSFKWRIWKKFLLQKSHIQRFRPSWLLMWSWHVLSYWKSLLQI